MTSNMAVLLIAAALFSSGPLAHAAPASLRDVLGKQDDRRPAPPPVAHYVSGDGQAFVLDRSGAVPLLKFEQSVEIWALSPSAAPRGDVIYRNDVGQPVLRATKLGGLTVFTAQRPSGAPAALMGEADFLRIPAPVSAATLLQRLAQASVRASRAAQHLIPFEASGVTPGSEPIYADAAALAAEGITRIARMPDGAGRRAPAGKGAADRRAQTLGGGERRGDAGGADAEHGHGRPPVVRTHNLCSPACSLIAIL